jgi:FMN phosphatase YigB (HAD superfamily)
MDIIFDLDGTLADCSHRLHFIQSKPKNWKAFFAGMEHDTPIKPTIDILRNLYPQNRIIFCTGRPDTHYNETFSWLHKHVVTWYGDLWLYMRAKGDGRPDYEVKLDLLSTMRADGFDPKVAFEDRDQVVDMWRRNGLICYQVAKGTY